MKHFYLKKIAASTFALSLIVFALAFQSDDDTPCDAKALKAKTQKTLEPYTYDKSKLTRIGYKAVPMLKETEIALFIGEKYRLAFNTEAVPQKVEVNIYNREKDNKKRKLLFSSKDLPADQHQFYFDYSFATKVFVDYSIPAGDSTSSGGCLIFMLGYK